MIDAQAVLADCFQAMFSQPIVENVLRGKLVESMVHLALSGHGWQRKDPWAGWDFEHTDKNRLEVKQAAARQTWDTTRTIDRKTNFDIAPRTGY
ncbi:MAG TPA: hypothetical protein VKI44_36995 [Acetobacteraceae bacterium]|nr:hypothetical protein [Acetobacteraceae bacterium]